MCAVLFQHDMYVIVVESTKVIDLSKYYVFKSFLRIFIVRFVLFILKLIPKYAMNRVQNTSLLKLVLARGK